jgi:thiazole synthase ThiGH ThiG subunit
MSDPYFAGPDPQMRGQMYLRDLLPPLESGEQMMLGRLRVEGEEIVLPVHFWAGNGDGQIGEARFAMDGADGVVMKAAIAAAVDVCREAANAPSH